MSKRDYYEILGVRRDADERELKSAYRSLAKQHHPDLNPDDHQAAAIFRDVAEAYGVLQDAQRRQLYDRLGHEGLAERRLGGMGAGFESVEDIFAQFSDIFEDLFPFNQSSSSSGPTATATPRAPQQRGRDLRATLDLTFEEALEGVSRTLPIQRKRPCASCGATGAAPSASPIPCQSCEGTGKITIKQGFFSVSSACSRCEGKGLLIIEACAECSSAGYLLEQRDIKLTIPAGVEDGARLRVKNKGEQVTAEGPRGDLLVTLHVAGSPIFERDGADLLYRAPISCVHAALGCKLRVPTLRGESAVQIEPGAQFGDIIRLAGEGALNPRDGQRGDLLVHLLVVVPTGLGSTQRDLLSALGDSLGLSLDTTSPLPRDETTRQWGQPRAEPQAQQTAGRTQSSTSSSLDRMLRQAEAALDALSEDA